MSEAENFYRCEGCPMVQKGGRCVGLEAAFVELDISNPDFKTLELECARLEKAGLVSQIIITKDGAKYPIGIAIHNALKEVLKNFFR